MCLFVGRSVDPSRSEIVPGFPGLLDFQKKKKNLSILSPFAAHGTKKRKIRVFSK